MTQETNGPKITEKWKKSIMLISKQTAEILSQMKNKIQTKPFQHSFQIGSAQLMFLRFLYIT